MNPDSLRTVKPNPNFEQAEKINSDFKDMQNLDGMSPIN